MAGAGRDARGNSYNESRREHTATAEAAADKEARTKGDRSRRCSDLRDGREHRRETDRGEADGEWWEPKKKKSHRLLFTASRGAINFYRNV